MCRRSRVVDHQYVHMKADRPLLWLPGHAEFSIPVTTSWFTLVPKLGADRFVIASSGIASICPETYVI